MYYRSAIQSIPERPRNLAANPLFIPIREWDPLIRMTLDREGFHFPRLNPVAPSSKYSIVHYFRDLNTERYLGISRICLREKFVKPSRCLPLVQTVQLSILPRSLFVVKGDEPFVHSLHGKESSLSFLSKLPSHSFVRAQTRPKFANNSIA